MIKYADEAVVKIVLNLFSKVWEEGRLLKDWEHVIIIPIVKPGKEPSIAGNYRPIALKFNLCKLMERMMANRLYYILESRGLLASYQYGFRFGYSTIDALIRLERDVKKALAMKEVLVAVYFDIKKA